jgi:allantoinase
MAALFEAGVFGFTCALAASDDDTGAVSADGLKESMAALARLNAPILARAELSGSIDPPATAPRARRWFDRLRYPSGAARQYATYLDHFPKAAENEAGELLIQLCQQYRLHTHVVHLSFSDPLTPIFHARSKGLPVTAGTCPHYLTFVAEEIPDGAVEYRCSPPIRERTNREFLWAALAGGLIQSIGSDHRPRAGDPTRNFLDGEAGIASIELGLSIVWTGAHAREYTLEQVARWMSSAPARLVGLTRKGAIDVGYDADLVVFDQDAEFTVKPAEQHGRRPITPYCGRRLRGVVKRTYLRGACIYADSGSTSAASGRVLFRG